MIERAQTLPEHEPNDELLAYKPITQGGRFAKKSALLCGHPPGHRRRVVLNLVLSDAKSTALWRGVEPGLQTRPQAAWSGLLKLLHPELESHRHRGRHNQPARCDIFDAWNLCGRCARWTSSRQMRRKFLWLILWLVPHGSIR